MSMLYWPQQDLETAVFWQARRTREFEVDKEDLDETSANTKDWDRQIARMQKKMRSIVKTIKI